MRLAAFVREIKISGASVLIRDPNAQLPGKKPMTESTGRTGTAARLASGPLFHARMARSGAKPLGPEGLAADEHEFKNSIF
jgi:hypothetical protein